MKEDKNFYKCTKCGKINIERMENGLFRFIFGKKKNSIRRSPVEMIIHGNIKMRCIRCTCDEWLIFNLLPTPNDWETPTNSVSQSAALNLRKSHTVKEIPNGS